jgi:hypothetical protein
MDRRFCTESPAGLAVTEPLRRCDADGVGASKPEKCRLCEATTLVSSGGVLVPSLAPLEPRLRLPYPAAGEASGSGGGAAKVGAAARACKKLVNACSSTISRSMGRCS